MKRIKVLHVASLDKPNYYLANLAEYSDPAQVEHSFVTLADPGNEFTPDMRERGLASWDVGETTRRSFPRAFRALGKVIDTASPDIVHTHLFDPSLLGLTAAWFKRRPTVLTRHHSDALHLLEPLPKRKFYLALESYISRMSDHIIAPSRMVRDILVDREGVPGEKVSVIPYGQTSERYDAVTPEDASRVRTELGIGHRTVLVCTSRLFHRKGHMYLFKAFADMKKNGFEADLLLVGSGDYQSALEAECARLNISDDVHFLGWRDDALAVIAAADIVVHPSLEDALSSAVIEAVMLERPIVATDISGVRDSLDDGRYGEIVRPADADSMREGIERVHVNMEAARERAAAGRRYLLEYMDAARVAAEYTKLYSRLVGIAPQEG